MAEEGERDNVSLLRAPTDSISDEAPETISEAVGETPTEAPVEAPETREETRDENRDGVSEQSPDGETHHEDDHPPGRRQKSWRTAVMWLVWASVYPCTLILIINEWANDSILPDFWVAPAFRGRMIKISWGVAIIGASLIIMAAGYLCMFTADLSLFDEGRQKYKFRRVAGWMFVASMICAVETLPFVIVICATRGWEPKAISYLISSSFTVLAVVLSIREICKHLLNYHKPKLQIHIIRVLWMVPIYAIDACLSLTLPTSKEAYPQAVRELYEAYTIWSFMQFLTLYLEDSAMEKEREAGGPKVDVVVDASAEAEEGLAVPEGLQNVLDSTRAALDKPQQYVMGMVDNVRKEVQDVLEFVPLANESLKLANETVKQANLYKESFKGTRRLHAMLTALEPTKHMVPYFCCGFGLKPWIGNKLVFKSRLGVLQYVPIMVMCVLITLITKSIPYHSEECSEADHLAAIAPHANLSNATEHAALAPALFVEGNKSHKAIHIIDQQSVAMESETHEAVVGDYFCEGVINPAYGWFWVSFFLNFSQLHALYCLIYFYYSTKTVLAPINPVGKFMAIKMIVFFTFWQNLGLSVLQSQGWLPWIDLYGSHTVAAKIQDILICTEMFCFAIWHRKCFSYKDYVHASHVEEDMSFWQAASNMFDVSDVVADTKGLMVMSGNKIKNKTHEAKSTVKDKVHKKVEEHRSRHHNPGSPSASSPVDDVAGADAFNAG